MVAYVSIVMPDGKLTPAYTEDIEHVLKNTTVGRRLMQKANITFMSQRAISTEPWLPRQFKSVDAYGSFSCATEPQTAFVYVLPTDDDDHYATRVKWGKNLAKIFTAMSTFEHEYKFGGDRTQSCLRYLGQCVIARDAIYAVRLFNCQSIQDVLEDDIIMIELFGSAFLTNTIRRKLAGLTPESPESLLDLVSQLKLAKL